MPRSGDNSPLDGYETEYLRPSGRVERQRIYSNRTQERDLTRPEIFSQKSGWCKPADRDAKNSKSPLFLLVLVGNFAGARSPLDGSAVRCRIKLINRDPHGEHSLVVGLV